MNRSSPLTPAEALALLDPSGVRGRDVAKATLMSLFAEKRLKMEQVTEKRFIGSTTTAKMSVANAFGATAPHVLSLVNLVRAAQPVTMPDFIKKAGKEYGSDFSGFLKKFVLPALAARGLVVEKVVPFLLFFKRRRYEHTPAGAVEKQRLEGLMAQAREIPSFLDSDPKKAAAIAVALGGLIFLLPELRPHFDAIGAAMRPPPGAHDSGGSGDSGSTASYEYSTGSTLEGGDLDLQGLDLASFDSAALETLSAEMDSFESSFDSSADSSGGGDSGGDSGGGDGGGGGD